MKTKDTIILEDVLEKSLFDSNSKLAKEYGTKEVTIDFQTNGNEKEIVDFISYDTKNNVFKCYEIKVSMQDFYNKSKKSWVGNYNFLVLSKTLFKQKSLENWKNEIPKHIGIIIIDTLNGKKQVIRKSSKVVISKDRTEILKNSLIRTLFYQNQKNKK